MPLPAFAMVYLLPLLATAGLLIGGPATWVMPILVWVGIPLAELGLRGSYRNAATEEETERRSDRRFDLVLYGLVPVQIGMVLLLGWRAPSLDPVALAGAILSVGTLCGALGINVAHELGHRRDALHQNLAKILLATSLYMHFFVEHNRGHHARVATPEDPASARHGESLYAFLPRSIVGSWRSAWELEAERVKRGGKSAWSLDNELVRFLLIQGSVIAGFLLAFGPVGALAFVGAAAIGILLLETVNYVEHYGLARNSIEGRYERVRPAHSWTTDRPLSRVLLFELTRHADHHAHPGRPYPALRHMPEAPELPTGYAGMVLLAFLPPAWFKVMDRCLAARPA
jgi:alkane 1-monooxygenase